MTNPFKFLNLRDPSSYAGIAIIALAVIVFLSLPLGGLFKILVLVVAVLGGVAVLLPESKLGQEIRDRVSDIVGDKESDS